MALGHNTGCTSFTLLQCYPSQGAVGGKARSREGYLSRREASYVRVQLYGLDLVPADTLLTVHHLLSFSNK